MPSVYASITTDIRQHPWKLLVIELVLVASYFAGLSTGDSIAVIVITATVVFGLAEDFMLKGGLIALALSGVLSMTSRDRARSAEIAAVVAFYMFTGGLALAFLNQVRRRRIPALERSDFPPAPSKPQPLYQRMSALPSAASIRLLGKRFAGMVFVLKRDRQLEPMAESLPLTRRHVAAHAASHRLIAQHLTKVLAGAMLIAIGSLQLYTGSQRVQALFADPGNPGNPELAAIQKNWRTQSRGRQRPPVVIHDASGTMSLAPRVSTLLRDRGYRVLSIVKQEAVQGEPVIRYQADFRAQAVRLERTLPTSWEVTLIGTTEPPSRRAPIDLTLGVPVQAGTGTDGSDLSVINVAVLNGSGINKDAANTAAGLRPRGFQVTRVANADRMTYPNTIIRYSPGHRRQARALATSIADRDPSLEPYPAAGADLVVILGRKLP